MGLDVKGVNKLLKKLDKLSSIESKKIVEEIAEDLSDVIEQKCPEDTGNSKEAVGIVEIRDYPTGTYIDVGFGASKDPFEKWKGAWFQQWGWNSGGKAHGQHIGWFDDAVSSREEEIMKKLKDKLREEIKAFKE